MEAYFDSIPQAARRGVVDEQSGLVKKKTAPCCLSLTSPSPHVAALRQSTSTVAELGRAFVLIGCVGPFKYAQPRGAGRGETENLLAGSSALYSLLAGSR